MAEEKKKVGTGFGVMLVRDEKVLLGKRHVDPNKADSVFRAADVWTMPGGKFEWGETLKEGAKRELKEETGIEVELENIEVMCVNCDKNEFAHFVTVGMLATKFEGEAKVMEPDEITEWSWFSFDSLPKNIYFPSIKVLECYREKKFTTE
jgi:ADP-ribose pyrophosphatase YjhB (NUDIX family)